ncbi:Lyso-phosphatidylcholine acyltransferase [Cryptotrichosporon argae]
MSMPASWASALTLSTIGLASKAFLRATTRSYEVHGRDVLLDALGIGASKGKGRVNADEYADKKRIADGKPGVRRGIVTICNHNSVVDDPMMWSLMPLSTLFPFAGPSHTCRNTRWTLGASDIMFTNPLFARFFTLGQVIETHRGGGIFQPAVDEAVKRLQDGGWIHIFPEGKVNQATTNPEGGLLRFKWGVGRIIMDSTVMPEIIPMWISGFDQIMNETRTAPRFVPRAGAAVSITVGAPLTPLVAPLVADWRRLAAGERGAVGVGGEWGGEGFGDAEQRAVRARGELAGGQEESVRKRIVQVLQDGMARLGEDVERREGRFDRGEWSQSRRRAGP